MVETTSRGETTCGSNTFVACPVRSQSTVQSPERPRASRQRWSRDSLSLSGDGRRATRAFDSAYLGLSLECFHSLSPSIRTIERCSGTRANTFRALYRLASQDPTPRLESQRNLKRIPKDQVCAPTRVTSQRSKSSVACARRGAVRETRDFFLLLQKDAPFFSLSRLLSTASTAHDPQDRARHVVGVCVTWRLRAVRASGMRRRRRRAWRRSSSERRGPTRRCPRARRTGRALRRAARRHPHPTHRSRASASRS